MSKFKVGDTLWFQKWFKMEEKVGFTVVEGVVEEILTPQPKLPKMKVHLVRTISGETDRVVSGQGFRTKDSLLNLIIEEENE